MTGLFNKYPEFKRCSFRTWGYTQQSTGYITRTILTFSSAMTGTATIIVKGRA